MSRCLNAHFGLVRTFNDDSLKRCSPLRTVGRVISSLELDLLVPRYELPDLYPRRLADGGLTGLHQIRHAAARFQLRPAPIHSQGALLGRSFEPLPLGGGGNRGISPVHNGHEL